MGFIYKITCSVSNKIYIGQTTLTLRERWNEHSSKYRKYKRKIENKDESFRGRSHLYRAMVKYGIDTFKMEMMEEIPNETLNDREKYWIKEFDSVKTGYNLQPGGANYMSTEQGKMHVKQRISETINANIDKFRKFKDELSGLPPKCRCTTDKGKKIIKIVNHKYCKSKKFVISDYADLETAKKAVADFIANLEANDKVYKPEEKKNNKLPSGILEFGDSGFIVQITVNGKKYRKNYTSRKKTREQNFNDAMVDLNAKYIQRGKPQINITYQEII